jgi:CIC family chloride channel protein
LKWNEKFNLPLAVRIGFAGLISGIVIAFLPSFFRDNAGLKEFLVRGELNSTQTALVLFAHYVLTIIAAGSKAPGGVFAPALVMGSALGYLVGDFHRFIFATDANSIFALVGMGALFTGIVRVPITAIMIVFELNANFNLVLPLMITCAVAYIIAETVEKGSLYQYMLKNMGIELAEEEELSQNNFLGHLKAANVMQSQVETTNSDVWVSDLLQLMTTSHHRGFPVMEQGRLVGIVTQSDLVKVSSGKTQVKVKDIMTKNPIVISADASLTDVLYLLNRYQLSRLPVLENNRLVGIITRTDIIRAEVNELKAESPVMSSSYYLIYQTCSPATGKGCILVPVSEDDDFRGLFKIAQAIARYHNYEIEFVRVIKIPQHQAPYSTKVDVRSARHTMHLLERMGRKAKIPVHTKIIVGHQRTAVLLEIIKNRHIDLLIMGWKHKSHSQEFIFSHLIDSLINKAPCELILVKLGKNKAFYPYHHQAQGSCIVPISGGPNIQEGLKLLPAFFNVYQHSKLPSVWLTQVYSKDKQQLDLKDLRSAAERLGKVMATDIHILPLCDDSVVSAIVHTAEIYHAELVIVGASREGLLKQAWYGNIPEQIADTLNNTVIIIRLPS